MSACKRRIMFFLVIASLVLATGFFIMRSVREARSAAELVISPGQSSLYIKEHDLAVKGQDKDGVTYFFLPSYAKAETISQKSSDNKVYVADGSLLSDPQYGVIQDVTIDLDEGEPVSWRICFMHSANLYTVNIDLKGTDVYDIEHDTYIPSSVSVYSMAGQLQYAKDNVLIKGRGNTTWDSVKQPYEIRLPESFPLCGMDNAPKWVLLSNFFDDTKIMNKMAMDLSDSMGMDYAIQSDWVDLYINGEYRGNYLLCKEPGIGKGRIEINDGILIEKDIRTSVEEDPDTFMSGDDLFRIKDPLPAGDDLKADINYYIERIDAGIHAFKDGGELPPIDTDSFTRRFMIDEFFNNPDSMQTSYYFYRHHGVLYAGPCWDYDLSCGKSLNGMEYYEYTESLLNDLPEDSLDWDTLLMQSAPYREEYNSLFREVEPILYDLIQNRIDDYADEISSSVAMDRALWQNDEIPVRFYAEMPNKYRFVKFYLYERLRLLADECGYNRELHGMSLDNGSVHTVTFMTEPEPYSIEVSDGSLLSEDDLPPCNTTEYSGWIYSREQKPFSPFLPVYEDITLELASEK